MHQLYPEPTNDVLTLLTSLYVAGLLASLTLTPRLSRDGSIPKQSLPYSLVQLKIKATEQASHRHIKLRMTEARNLGSVSERWMCECGYETIFGRMTYLIPIQTRVPRPYGIKTRSIRARPELFESHRSGRNFDGSGKYEGSRRMSRGVMLTGV